MLPVAQMAISYASQEWQRYKAMDLTASLLKHCWERQKTLIGLNMKTIFVIDGAAGTGKSDMVKYLSTRKRSAATLVQKFTTRKER